MIWSQIPEFQNLKNDFLAIERWGQKRYVAPNGWGQNGQKCNGRIPTNLVDDLGC